MGGLAFSPFLAFGYLLCVSFWFHGPLDSDAHVVQRRILFLHSASLSLPHSPISSEFFLAAPCGRCFFLRFSEVTCPTMAWKGQEILDGLAFEELNV